MKQRRVLSADRGVVRRSFVLCLDGVPRFNVQTRSRHPEAGDRQEVVDWLAEDLHLPASVVDQGLVELDAVGGDRVESSRTDGERSRRIEATIGKARS